MITRLFIATNDNILGDPYIKFEAFIVAINFKRIDIKFNS